MASLSTTLKPISSFSSFVKQRNPTSNNNALFTYHTPNSTNYMLFKRGGSMSHKKHTFVAVHDAPDPVESSLEIPFPEVVVVRKKSKFWERSWNSRDVIKLARTVVIHSLSLSAPFHFSWAAFRLFFWLVIFNGICITLSYHRNLSHRSFDLPKWLEYLFAYGGVLAFQGVATVVRSQTTFLVNSVCHIWGTRAWNTPNLSKNNWWVAIITFGEGWHNNHHAFEFSARHGLEWWQLDVTWYLIRFLEAIGLATNVKLPTEAQKKRMSRN
ncbi:hypothetical protein Bca101_060496 [Brassica carinata]